MTPRKSKKRSGSTDSILSVPAEPVRPDPSVTAPQVHTDLPEDPPQRSFVSLSMFSLIVSILALLLSCVAIWFSYNNRATKPVVQPVQSQPSVVRPVQPAQAACADRSYTVTAEKNRREGLWGISKEMYGGIGHLNMKIFEANRNIIENPDIIQPGWVLVIPGCPEDNLSTTRVP